MREKIKRGASNFFKIITKPEVKISKYRGLGVKPNEVKVTKEEIIAVAKKVKMNTVYILEGSDDNGENWTKKCG